MDFNESIMEASMMVVPRGAPNKANAMAFLNHALSAPAQAAAAKAIYYGPVNAAAFDELEPEVAKRLSGNPDQQGKEVQFDPKFWGENLDALQQKLDGFRA
jgi:putative spermidine/putrescine transport system substrate-binding protein